MKNRYTLLGYFKLFIWFVRTKMICTKARIIRFPFDLRGGKYIDFGEQLTTGIGCRFEAFSENKEKVISFGKGVQVNDYVHICGMKSVKIGNDVLIAGKVYISDNSHGIYKGSQLDSLPDISPIKRDYFISPVLINDNVWIGENVVILPGVTIGKGAIIGANSVVSKSLPENVIAVGIPAKPIKKFNFVSKKWEKIEL
jgi:acetyltransferase-like isoleucine patch superfamily enzyme